MNAYALQVMNIHWPIWSLLRVLSQTMPEFGTNWRKWLKGDQRSSALYVWLFRIHTTQSN